MTTRTSRTRRLIYGFLQNEGKPTRYSVIKKAVMAQYPEATVNSSLQYMRDIGSVKRVSFERDAKYIPGRLKFVKKKSQSLLFGQY